MFLKIGPIVQATAWPAELSVDHIFKEIKANDAYTTQKPQQTVTRNECIGVCKTTYGFRKPQARRILFTNVRIKMEISINWKAHIHIIV